MRDPRGVRPGFERPRLLVQRHLSPLVDAALLERTHPEAPNHPEQAYRTVTRSVS